ncbi:MAG: DNA topoisomerase I [Desulfurococcaceae archaeon]|nr:DNA topoisomerase I [Desulfurococcaceae archaeon]
MNITEFRDHIVIVAEKPKAAAKIAQALGISRRFSSYGVPYWVGRVDEKLVVVVGVAGHMFTLSSDEDGYPVFNYKWVPRWFEDRDAKFLMNYYKVVSKLLRNASEYINACDYDIEGSVIGYMVISNFGDIKKAKRMKFSSLTIDELRNAYNNLRPLDWDMIEAGLCRHELDWLWGINVSRALSDIFRRVYGRRITLSAGRVQSPTLVEVANNTLITNTFVPDVSFSLRVKIRVKGEEYFLENLFNPLDSLDVVKQLVDDIRKHKYLEIANVEVLEEVLDPLPPFNLPDLQYEAFRIYGFSPSKTLSIAEELYLDSLISYPRTNSQKLPKTLNNRSIISNIAKIKEYSVLAKELLSKERLIPVEGVRDDPAHPAIYPTGYQPRRDLGRDAVRLYDLIVRRYLASFADPAKIRKRRYFIKFSKLTFSLSGSEVINTGWLRYYPFYRLLTRRIPSLRVGDVVEVIDVRVTHIYSKRPQRYTKASILKWMESVGIGTEATRAEIIETLFKRGYLKTSSKYVDVTDLGFQVVKILNTFFNDLTSVELTRKFEDRLTNIIKGRVSRSSVISEAKDVLKGKFKQFKDFIDGKDVSVVLKLVGMSNDIKCQICGRGAYDLINGIYLCEFHKIAYDNIKDMYRSWSKKLGINWCEYLKKLSKLKSLGKFSKEVVNYLINDCKLKP